VRKEFIFRSYINTLYHKTSENKWNQFVCCAPGTVLGTEDPMVNKLHGRGPHAAYVCGEDR
jgi:hypothetical protein